MPIIQIRRSQDGPCGVSTLDAEFDICLALAGQRDSEQRKEVAIRAEGTFYATFQEKIQDVQLLPPGFTNSI